VIYLVATYAHCPAVEGRRKATDRLMTGFIVGAFLLALVPLVSVWRHDPGQRPEPLRRAFFNNSMRNVDGEGGGAVHAIYGTLMITGLRDRSSRCRSGC
jgi:phosphate transport system permease protein